jgi:hypothetical protein
MIEDLLPGAFNAAQSKAKQLHAEAMQTIAGGLPIAGLQDMLSPQPGSMPGDQDKA